MVATAAAAGIATAATGEPAASSERGPAALSDPRQEQPPAAAPVALRRTAFASAHVLGEAGIGPGVLDAEWQLPATPAAGLVLLQHGFTRRCANLRTTAQRLAAQGLATLCLNAEMARGNPELAEELATALGDGSLRLPDGTPLPARIVVGGHSAGALFAARVGARLAVRAPQRLAGALLLDPVGGTALADALAAIVAAGRPLRVVLAPSGRCNARHLALPALLQAQRALREAGGDGFVGVQLATGTHADAEGEDTDGVAIAACGPPQPANVEHLRALATDWALDMVEGTRRRGAYPGGEALQAAIGDGSVLAIGP